MRCKIFFQKDNSATTPRANDDEGSGYFVFRDEYMEIAEDELPVLFFVALAHAPDTIMRRMPGIIIAEQQRVLLDNRHRIDGVILMLVISRDQHALCTAPRIPLLQQLFCLDKSGMHDKALAHDRACSNEKDAKPRNAGTLPRILQLSDPVP